MPREHERESSDNTIEHESRDDMYWIGAVLKDKRLENILLWTRTRVVCLSVYGIQPGLADIFGATLMFIAFQCWTEQRDTYACWARLVSSVDESTRLRIVDLERQKMERTTNKAYINVRKDNQVVMRAIVGNSIRLPGASCVPKN